MGSTPYDRAFYLGQARASRDAADRIVPLVVGILKPASVVDVGCGVGTWLASFQEAGVERVVGIDGDYVDRSQLQIPPSMFRPTDLDNPIRLDERFDLAVSLEVAEHLSPSRSRSFVADLTKLAPTVLFSAAIPGQGGTDHVNERWQDEWARMFAEHGFRPVDLIRPAVWEDPLVPAWYRQNTLLYVSEPLIADPAPTPLRLVHPGTFEGRPEYTTLREHIQAIPQAARISARYRLRRASARFRRSKRR